MTEETWYTAEEAVEVGLADRVYQKDDKDPDMNARRIIEQTRTALSGCNGRHLTGDYNAFRRKEVD